MIKFIRRKKNGAWLFINQELRNRVLRKGWVKIRLKNGHKGGGGREGRRQEGRKEGKKEGRQENVLPSKTSEKMCFKDLERTTVSDAVDSSR